MSSLLAVTILGFTFSGREFLIGAAVVVIIAGAIGWYIYSRRTK
jgi:hypothetical protein